MTIGIFIKAPICKKHCKSQWIRKVSDLQSIGNQSFLCLFWTVIFDVSLDTQKHKKANQIGPHKSIKSLKTQPRKTTQKTHRKKLIFSSKIYSQKASKFIQNHSRSVLDPTRASSEPLGPPMHHFDMILVSFLYMLMQFQYILVQFWSISVIIWLCF